jgi:hypothetical protein
MYFNAIWLGNYRRAGLLSAHENYQIICFCIGPFCGGLSGGGG